MYINPFFELSMGLDRSSFDSLVSAVYEKSEYIEESGEEIIDRSIEHKGIVVVFRDSQYKKKVRLIVSPTVVLKGNALDTHKLVRKLEKRISEYFNRQYELDDFNLSAMNLTVNIDVGSSEKVSSYIRVIQKIGKVKGFSPVSYEGISEKDSLCLEGNSNFVSFKIYSLQKFLADHTAEKCSETADGASGILQAEVRLMKPKAIRSYTNELVPSRQISNLCGKCGKIFFDTFTLIIPEGDFYKKEEADEIIRQKVEDSRLQRRMLHLITLIPEKKSLLLSQKALNYRWPERIMEAFADIDLSPITISKRNATKHLKSLYSYFE